MQRAGWRIGTASYDADAVESYRQLDGTVFDLVALGSGRPAGSLAYAATDGFDICLIDKALPPTRILGPQAPESISLNLILSRQGRKSYWSQDVDPGFLTFTPPGAEVESLHEGRSSYAVLTLGQAELIGSLAGETRLRDLEFWRRPWVAPAVASAGDALRRGRRLSAILAALKARGEAASPETVDFWRRSMVEVFASLVPEIVPPEPDDPIRNAARLVREVERYVDRQGHRPVHISEICASLNVSRRSLHRAFDEVLGVGPVTFFRHKRLSQVHAALRRAAREGGSVTEIAFDYGFTEMGRFSQYYRALFGELPSQTLRQG
mgnify:CR=1 FL=1